MAKQVHSSTRFNITIFALIGLGLGVVSSMFVLSIWSGAPSPGVATLYATMLGAGVTGILALFYRTRILPPVHALTSIPGILLVGYPLFGLLISGIAFGVCAPTLPCNSESEAARWLGYGVRAQAVDPQLQPRWLLALLTLGPDIDK